MPDRNDRAQGQGPRRRALLHHSAVLPLLRSGLLAGLGAGAIALGGLSACNIGAPFTTGDDDGASTVAEQVADDASGGQGDAAQGADEAAPEATAEPEGSAPRKEGGSSEGGDGAAGCPQGQTFCEGLCTDLTVDPSNCGQCGHVCKTEVLSATPMCDGAGGCTFACYNGASLCAGGAACALTPSECPP